MTTPDSRPVLDVIAEATGQTLREHQLTTGMAVTSGATCRCGYWSGVEEPGKTRPVGYQGLQWHQSVEVAAAVLAACQGATVEQQAELTGAEVESVQYGAVDAGPGWHRQSRLVGPWREDLS